ncbi:MAG: DUF333 domain-containing protein [Caldilineales bacterium]
MNRKFRTDRGHWLLVLLALLVIASLFSGCFGVKREVSAPEAATEAAAVGMANPASVFCIEQGGTLEIRKDAAGNEAGYCRFTDGSECEEWAFMNGECKPGQIAAAPAGEQAPAQPASQITLPIVEVPGVAAPADADTAALINEVLAAQPADALLDGGIGVLPLKTAEGSQPLWAVYSHGMRNYALEQPASHFVSIYTNDGGTWQQLATQSLDEAVGDGGLAPDYIAEGDVQQVALDPSLTWLTVNGGMGAHSGSFQVLSFDGSTLTPQLSSISASPGAGRVADVNGDGQNEVVLDASDPYVFCYACGVRRPAFEVKGWTDGALSSAQLGDLPADQQGTPLYEANHAAVTLAQAGLWHDAMTKADEAAGLAGAADPALADAVRWNQSLIRLNHDAQAAAVSESAYPLVNKVFYGDYAGAVAEMGQYDAAQLFAADSPLVTGTAAQDWQPELSQYLKDSATAALAAKPELADAYFVRAWGENLNKPGSAQVMKDLAKAAELAPDNALFSNAAAAASAAFAAAPAAADVPERDRVRIPVTVTGRQVVVPGNIEAGQERLYVVAGEAGQTLDVSVISRNDEVILSITGADGASLVGYDAASAQWQGQIPTTQDYIIALKGAQQQGVFRMNLTLSAAQ